MIPLFPKFKTLNINDKGDVDNFVRKFPPYSDYNFISMFVWCTDPPPLISRLNNNLVLRINDYITNEPFYTFLGLDYTIQTADTLMDLSIQEGLPNYLKLIPEITIQSDPNIFSKFDIKEDRDQFDYIFSIPDLASHRGNKYAEKRNFINRFKKTFSFEDRKIDLRNIEIQRQIVNLFEVWGKVRNKDQEQIKQELAAYKKALKHCHDLNLLTFGIYVKETLIGVSINEILHEGYAINLFEKGDTTYTGIFQMLKHLAGVYLSKERCNYLNFEQDLGVEGLRKSKTSYHPLFFLKKYIIYKKLAD